MLHHQDQPLNFRGSSGSSSLLRNRKANKDGNFNFLPGKDDDGFAGTGDENRNQVRPRTLGPLGHDPPSSSPSSGFHHGSGLLSPRSRLPCWSPLEPLPEIESGDDGYGRVPPDGAEERRMEEEEGRAGTGLRDEKLKKEQQRRRSFRGRQQDDLEDQEWADSDSESEYSFRSGGSMSDLNMESGGEGTLMGGWDRIGVGEPRTNQQDGDPNSNTEPRRRSFSRRNQPGGGLGHVLEEDDRSSDSDGELPELMDAVWTLRDRERFKAQEMEKHQVQLTMYRRLALIRWVRTLQGRVQEQQNRLQSSFDVILTHRKELLRMELRTARSRTKNQNQN
uniref:Uncharacterized protein n=1 Tax=Amphiprion percula TaxID=161767 RepID=A0A3P8TYS7_AMPPE